MNIEKNKGLLQDCERYLMMIEEELQGANPYLCETKRLSLIKRKLQDVYCIIEESPEIIQKEEPDELS